MSVLGIFLLVLFSLLSLFGVILVFTCDGLVNEELFKTRFSQFIARCGCSVLVLLVLWFIYSCFFIVHSTF